MRHTFRTIDDSLFVAPPAYKGHATAFRRADLIGRAQGSVHMNFSIAELQPGGTIDACVHSYEKGIFLLDSEVELNRDGRTIRLSRYDYALVPVGTPHAFRNRGKVAARWVEKCAPQPKAQGEWKDSFFVKPLAWSDDAASAKSPLNRLVGHFDRGQLPPAPKGDEHRSGQTKKMLIDAAFGGFHFDMFMIEFSEGGKSTMHDHNFEEAYLVLEGEGTFESEGEKYVLKPGTIAWSGVGAPHAFTLDRNSACMWLEVMSPQPPLQDLGRRYAAWEKIRSTLEI